MARKKTRQKGRNSLVARLNTRLFLRLAGIFLCMDLLLAALCALGVVFWSEQQASDIAQLVAERGVPSRETSDWMAAGDYTVTALDRPPEGTAMPSAIPGPENLAGGLRTFCRGEQAWFFGRWTSRPGRDCAYVVEMSNGGEPYAIRLDLSGAVTVLVYAGRILLVCQVISLVLNLFKNAGTIKKVLHPIQELAATAAKLNTVTAMSQEELQTLAGQLNAINATHLDTRIPVEGTQKELKNLAEAINAMLERINQAYRAQARFVSDASHELRTPISVIQGYARLLDRWGKEDPETMQEAIDAISAEADSMKELVEQLLFLARGDNDSARVEMEDVDLTEIASQVMKEMAMVDETHRFSARWSQPVPIHADPGLIKQAIRVLTDNAIQYTPQGGLITLSVTRTRDTARVSVTDDGQGIDAASIPHIFERFYRTDESRARQTGGTGLGLAIAKWIADRHGGWFEVTSRKDVGTRFTLVLPAAVAGGE